MDTTKEKNMENRQPLNFETENRTFYEAYLTKKTGPNGYTHEETKREKTLEDLKRIVNLLLQMGYTLERAEKVEIAQVTTLSA